MPGAVQTTSIGEFRKPETTLRTEKSMPLIIDIEFDGMKIG